MLGPTGRFDTFLRHRRTARAGVRNHRLPRREAEAGASARACRRRDYIQLDYPSRGSTMTSSSVSLGLSRRLSTRSPAMRCCDRSWRWDTGTRCRAKACHRVPSVCRLSTFPTRRLPEHRSCRDWPSGVRLNRRGKPSARSAGRCWAPLRATESRADAYARAARNASAVVAGEKPSLTIGIDSIDDNVQKYLLDRFRFDDDNIWQASHG